MEAVGKSQGSPGPPVSKFSPERLAAARAWPDTADVSCRTLWGAGLMPHRRLLGS